MPCSRTTEACIVRRSAPSTKWRPRMSTGAYRPGRAALACTALEIGTSSQPGPPKRTALPLSSSTATTNSGAASSRKSLLRPRRVNTSRRKCSISRAVEQPGRHQSAEAGDQVGPARVAGGEQQVAPEFRGQARQARGATQVLEEGRAQEGLGTELHVVAGAGDEDPAHLGGAHAVGEAGGEEGAGADADVAVEPGQVEAIEGLVERAQRAQLVHPADRAAAGDGQADLRGALAGGRTWRFGPFAGPGAVATLGGVRRRRGECSRWLVRPGHAADACANRHAHAR